MGDQGTQPKSIAHAHRIPTVRTTDAFASTNLGTERDARQSSAPARGLAVSLALACILWPVIIGVSYAIGGLAGAVLGILGVVGLTACVLGLALRRANRANEVERHKPARSMSQPSPMSKGAR